MGLFWSIWSGIASWIGSPDRRAETFATWLEAHPGIEVISRDRASAYAEGGRMGAPAAIQVADRWHLLGNVADALEPVLKRHEHLFKDPKKTREKQESAVLELRLTPAQHHRREQLQESYAQVQSLYEQGHSLREIAKMVGIDTNTLRYFMYNQPWASSQDRGGTQSRRGEPSTLSALHPETLESRVPQRHAIVARGTRPLATPDQLPVYDPIWRCCVRPLLSCCQRGYLQRSHPPQSKKSIPSQSVGSSGWSSRDQNN
jgi:transposase